MAAQFLVLQLVPGAEEDVQVFLPVEEESVAEYIPLVGTEVGLGLVYLVCLLWVVV